MQIDMYDIGGVTVMAPRGDGDPGGLRAGSAPAPLEGARRAYPLSGSISSAQSCAAERPAGLLETLLRAVAHLLN
jgi:hypothetical protein